MIPQPKRLGPNVDDRVWLVIGVLLGASASIHLIMEYAGAAT